MFGFFKAFAQGVREGIEEAITGEGGTTQVATVSMESDLDDDPDAPFSWGRRHGYVYQRPGRDGNKYGAGGAQLHALSFGTTKSHVYTGKDGPRGFTPSDTELVSIYISTAKREGRDVAGYVIEDSDGAEWEFDTDRGGWVFSWAPDDAPSRGR